MLGRAGVYGAINDWVAVGDGCWTTLDWANAADDSTVAAPSVSAKIVFIVVLRIRICDACATAKIETPHPPAVYDIVMGNLMSGVTHNHFKYINLT
jgi:hypothetical protein